MKKFIKVFLALFCALTIVNINVKKTEATAFTPRLSAPPLNSKYYYSSANPFYAAGLAPTAGLDADGNCTWYAFGRAYEILGRYPTGLSTGMPNRWWYDTTNFKKGQMPKVGSIAVWQGHVAVVEKIENGVLTLSNSSYITSYYPNGARFFLQTGTDAQIRNYNGGGFLGYIYLVDNPEITNPTTPSQPEISSKRNLLYDAHISNVGWKNNIESPNVAGVTDKGNQIEAMKLKLNKLNGSIYYRTHVAKKGWESGFKKNGELSGTTGESKAVEAFEVKLDSNLANQYDVFYTSYVRGMGWLGWSKNGQSSGSTGLSLPIEAFRINIVRKGVGNNLNTANNFITKDNPSISYTGTNTLGTNYNASAPNIMGQAANGALKNITINASNISGNIEFRSHIANVGWESAYKKQGQSTGDGKNPIEAVQMRLTGPTANMNDLYYSVYANGYGWLGWAKNNAIAGTTGLKSGISAIRVMVVPKGTNPNVSTARPYLTQNNVTIVRPKLVYTTATKTKGWLPVVGDSATSGNGVKGDFLTGVKLNLNRGNIYYRTKKMNKPWDTNYATNTQLSGNLKEPIEGIQIKLSDELAQQYDVCYRVYVEGKGWLGWASNHNIAGSEGLNAPIQAIQVKIVDKHLKFPVHEKPWFIRK